ncbi:MAG: hypothetical protein M3Q86_08270 [Verrucomicrobiota bacterium]|nr:hypothetical protein [Verrucomicrobiota bacterium]
MSDQKWPSSSAGRRPDKSFTTTSVNYTYHFTATQHQTLASCLANNGVIALGLDSDCHFFNHGIHLRDDAGAAALSSGDGN